MGDFSNISFLLHRNIYQNLPSSSRGAFTEGVKLAREILHLVIVKCRLESLQEEWKILFWGQKLLTGMLFGRSVQIRWKWCSLIISQAQAQ